MVEDGTWSAIRFHVKADMKPKVALKGKEYIKVHKRENVFYTQRESCPNPRPAKTIYSQLDKDVIF